MMHIHPFRFSVVAGGSGLQSRQEWLDKARKPGSWQRPIASTSSGGFTPVALRCTVGWPICMSAIHGLRPNSTASRPTWQGTCEMRSTQMRNDTPIHRLEVNDECFAN